MKEGAYMPNSPNKKNYNANYAKEKLKRIPLDVQKDKYEEIKSAADDAKETVNGYIKVAIDERMERQKRIKKTKNPFAEENTDYFHSTQMLSKQKRGNFAQDFKLTANFAKKLCMQGKTERAEQARDNQNKE